ncbi:MAG TPA: phage baseplate assembly protein V [Longimicrobium sp.]|nr:phage baseplate assembly protein V [Longimicrobium sp.]
MSRRFWGKYRGKVILNLDPENRGRVQVSCPAVLGTNLLSWAMPCVPMAGLMAGTYAIPPVNANVWVEFEGGDPEKPIWTGCFWGTGELPTRALQTPQPAGPIVIQAPNTQNRVVVGGSPADGITLETVAGPAGPMVKVDATGITIQDGAGGMITIKAGAVTVNMGALMIK